MRRGQTTMHRRINVTLPEQTVKIHGFTYDGILVYTKGKLHRESGQEVYYILISSKKAVEG
jgi:hypothetical protein